MRLLPGYTMPPAPAKAVVLHRPSAPPARAAFVDAAFEVLPALMPPLPAATELLRARAAVQLYSSVYRINEPSTGRLSVFA